ncbi:unnamed protein product, partial [Cyprideis torosa]
VLGPSGAGKSTLLDAIAGFRVPTQGRILWQGTDLTHAAPNTRPVSILFQDGNLFPHLDIWKNASLALRPDGGRPNKAEQNRIKDALAQVELAQLADRKPGTLSGGQQSRAALARVLLQERPILLLDEPFAALGPALKADMLALVTKVADRLGALTLMVTHAPEDAERFANQTIVVADGFAHPPVDTKPLLANPPATLRAYLG